LLQENTPCLIKNLLDHGFKVLLETNGSLDISAVDPRCARIVDIKLPGSGAAEKNNLKNIALLHERDELKFVIAGEKDYLAAKDLLKLIPQEKAGRIVINFSPVSSTLDPAELAAWILADRLLVRLNLQLHKCLWPGEMRGV